MITSSRDHFYDDILINNLNFEKIANINFKFQANDILIINDDDITEILFSFNGEDLDGRLLKRERITMNNKHQSKIWFKINLQKGSGTKVRVFAWI